MCSNFDSVDSPSGANEKGASVMAGIAEVSRKFIIESQQSNYYTHMYMQNRSKI